MFRMGIESDSYMRTFELTCIMYVGQFVQRSCHVAHRRRRQRGAGKI